MGVGTFVTLGILVWVKQLFYVTVLSWLNVLDRIYKLTSLNYFWTKVVVYGNLVPTNNPDNYC